MTEQNTSVSPLTSEPPDEATYCYRHPQTETGLRCSKCERYICVKCAQRTPVGYICPECQRGLENRFFTGKLSDYGIAALIAGPLSLVTAGIFGFLLGGLGLFIIWIGLPAAAFAGGIIAEAVRWGVQKRRSRYLARVVAGCLIGATLVIALFNLLTGNLYSLLALGILLFVGSGTIMARLR